MSGTGQKTGRAAAGFTRTRSGRARKAPGCVGLNPGALWSPVRVYFNYLWPHTGVCLFQFPAPLALCVALPSSARGLRALRSTRVRGAKPKPGCWAKPSVRVHFPGPHRLLSTSPCVLPCICARRVCAARCLHTETLRGTRFAMDIVWIISVSNDV